MIDAVMVAECLGGVKERMSGSEHLMQLDN